MENPRIKGCPLPALPGDQTNWIVTSGSDYLKDEVTGENICRVPIVIVSIGNPEMEETESGQLVSSISLNEEETEAMVKSLLEHLESARADTTAGGVGA